MLHIGSSGTGAGNGALNPMAAPASRLVDRCSHGAAVPAVLPPCPRPAPQEADLVRLKREAKAKNGFYVEPEAKLVFVVSSAAPRGCGCGCGCMRAWNAALRRRRVGIQHWSPAVLPRQHSGSAAAVAAAAGEERRQRSRRGAAASRWSGGVQLRWQRLVTACQGWDGWSDRGFLCRGSLCSAAAAAAAAPDVHHSPAVPPLLCSHAAHRITLPLAGAHPRYQRRRPQDEEDSAAAAPAADQQRRLPAGAPRRLGGGWCRGRWYLLAHWREGDAVNSYSHSPYLYSPSPYTHTHVPQPYRAHPYRRSTRRR